MKNNTNYQTIVEISEDIARNRGCAESAIPQWAASYTQWKDAADALSMEEYRAAITEGYIAAQEEAE